MSVFIIAEVGPNHNGKLHLALELVRRLAAIGVDAVKFQLSCPEEAASLDAFEASYQKHEGNVAGVIEAAKRRQLSHEEHRVVAAECASLGVEYLCTAFDLGSLVFLNEELNVQRFKVASGEIFSVDMLAYMSRAQKPIVLSTGMATYDEVSSSLGLLNAVPRQNITLLHCVSNYPAPLADVNLRCMPELQRRFKCDVGYSDHTIGNSAAIAAVALGAAVIEKHVTLDRSLPGPDHKASATVDEFAKLVCAIREVELCLGRSEKRFSNGEQEIARVARKSIVAKRDLQPGEILTQADICYRRPGTGFLPTEKCLVLGKRVTRAIRANRVIHPEDLA